MIWYEEEITAKGQPEDITLELVGTYRNSTITIKLEIESSTDDIRTQVLYTKVISGLAYEDPTHEQVRNKFMPKLLRLKKRVENTEYTILVND